MAEQIRVSEENWRWLNSLKQPADSFDDVLTRLREQDPEEFKQMIEQNNYGHVEYSGDSDE